MHLKQEKTHRVVVLFSLYFISVLFLENIEASATCEAHGQITQIWSSRLQVPERLRLLSGHYVYGLATWPLRPQIKGGIVPEYIHLKQVCRL